MISTLRKRGRLYYVRVRLNDWPRPRYFALGVSDRQVAEQKRAELIRRLELQSVGYLPSDTALEASGQPILSLLEAFVADVEARGGSANTVRLYGRGVATVCRECRWVYLRDITRASCEIWRNGGLAPVVSSRRGAWAAPLNNGGAKRRDGGAPRRRPERAGGSPPLGAGEGAWGPARPTALRAANTINHMLGYVKTFLRWCGRRGFLEGDPLRYVDNIRIKANRGYRRALPLPELGRFLASVPRHRAAVYATAYYAGIRRNELNRLKRGDFHLDAPKPFVRIPGFVAKNGKTQDVPLHAALVPVLRSYWTEDLAPFAWAFYGHVPNMDTYRRDLQRAGIPYIDEDGRRLDFHALRTNLNTHLREHGVGLEDRMAIMRWSDPRLARETYMDERQISVAAELEKLPDVCSNTASGLEPRTAVQPSARASMPLACSIYQA